MSCSDFKSSTVSSNLRGMKRKLDMKLINGDKLRKQLTKGCSSSTASPPISCNNRSSKLNHQNDLQFTSSQTSLDHHPLHHHNYHHQLKSSSNEVQLLCRLRQTMFNISLAKLSRYRHIPDPSLLRSVMICNTLKRLEKDLESEGVKVSFGPNGVYFIPNNASNSSPINPITSDQTNISDQTTTSDQATNPRTDESNTTFNTTITTTTASSPSPSGTPLQFPPSPSSSPSFSPSSHSSNNPIVPSRNNPSSCTSNHGEINPNGDGEETFLLDLDSGGRITPFPRNMETYGSENDADSEPSLSGSESEIRIDGDMWQAQGDTWSSSSMVTCIDTSDMQDESRSSSDDQLSRSVQNVVSSDEGVSSGSEDLHELQPVTHLSLLTKLGEIDQSLRNATLSSPSSSSSSDPIPSSFGSIDIDVSQYDFDMMSPISPPNMRLTPVSAEELLKSVVLHPNANQMESNANQMESNPNQMESNPNQMENNPNQMESMAIPTTNAVSQMSTNSAPMSTASISMSSSVVTSSSPMMVSSPSCATQSTQSMISNSKNSQYYCKKDSTLFIVDDSCCPTAIS